MPKFKGRKKKEEKKMNETILMSIVALAISVAFVSVGMAQQTPAAGQKPATAQASAAAVQKPVSAQTFPAKENWEKVRGTVEKVDEATKEVTVQTQKDKMMTFSVGEHSYITEVTTGMPLSTLKKGMEVTVEYAKEGNKLMGKWIDVHMGKAEANPMTLAQAKEVKKEKSSATSAQAKEVKKETSSAPKTQGKEVKKESAAATPSQAKEVKKENPSGTTTEKK
jgi:hypothetical protein